MRRNQREISVHGTELEIHLIMYKRHRSPLRTIVLSTGIGRGNQLLGAVNTDTEPWRELLRIPCGRSGATSESGATSTSRIVIRQLTTAFDDEREADLRTAS